MTNPIQGGGLPPFRPIGPLDGPGAPGQPNAADGAEGTKFYDVLMDSLDHVHQLQNEASDATQRLMTGEETNPELVFSAMRKSEVAFNLLMEIRNKLVDAYRDIEQMRV